MTKYTDMDTNELGNYLSDYHKDFYGFRPRYEGLYSDRARMIAMLEGIDSTIAIMRKTFAGREELREQGWYVLETDPTYIQQSTWLSEERALAQAEREAKWEKKYA